MSDIVMNDITLLVVDDEPVVRAFIKRFIQSNQLPVNEILEASNGPDAVRLALEYRPDLILMDIRMPGQNGLDASREILAGFPQAKIVMVTAYDEFEYVRTALRTGVEDYLLKPIEHNTLAAMIKKAAQNKADAQSAALTQPTTVRDTAAGHPLVRSVSEYVNDNLDTPLRLDDIAAAVFLSPSHLSRTFRKLAGVSISEFIAGQRLENAVHYLQNTGMSVTEIAEQLGFSSATYFTAWFRRMTGQPPLQFRKKSS